MDFTTRNDTFLENEAMLRRVMRRNLPLIHALRLEWDDVYQELAIAALHAIDSFDPNRSECIQAHIWMQLQYAILTIERRNRPGGITCLGKQRLVVVSLDQSEGMERFLATESRDETSELSPQMRQALSRLDEAEREAVIRYLNGQKAKRESSVRSALDKIRYYYLSAIAEPRYSVEIW